MSNQFSFTCPIFNVETKFSHCTELRHRVYRGEPVKVRKGCQACMASGKCPVAREVNASIVQSMSLVEHYVSPDEPKKGKLRAQVLRDIRPVIVQQRHLDQFGVSAGEQDLIATADKRIDAMVGTAPEKSLKPYVDRTKRETKANRMPIPARQSSSADNSINQAAATGDLAAAINQAA